MKRVSSFALGLLVGCGSLPGEHPDGTRTAVVVIVEADAELADLVDRFELDVIDGDGDVRLARSHTGDDVSFPARQGVVPDMLDATRTFEVHARVFDADGASLGEQRARVGFVRGEVRYLTLRFTSACREVACGALETCREGACVGACATAAAEEGGEVSFAECSTIDAGMDAGRDGGLDGGALDGGAGDGGVDAGPTDGGVPRVSVSPVLAYDFVEGADSARVYECDGARGLDLVVRDGEPVWSDEGLSPNGAIAELPDADRAAYVALMTPAEADPPVLDPPLTIEAWVRFDVAAIPDVGQVAMTLVTDSTVGSPLAQNLVLGAYLDRVGFDVGLDVSVGLWNYCLQHSQAHPIDFTRFVFTLADFDRPHHLVFVHEPHVSGPNERTYVDGRSGPPIRPFPASQPPCSDATEHVPGERIGYAGPVSSDGFALRFGAEPGATLADPPARELAGTLHMVAIYDVALDEDAVMQNYAAGPNADPCVP